MYTQHGHQIPGTPVEGELPLTIARCGGVGFCRLCSSEARQAARQTPIPPLFMELGPITLAAIERAIVLAGEAQRPLSQAQEARKARASFRNLNTAAAMSRLKEVIDASDAVSHFRKSDLFTELLNSGIEFYYDPDAGT